MYAGISPSKHPQRIMTSIPKTLCAENNDVSNLKPCCPTERLVPEVSGNKYGRVMNTGWVKNNQTSHKKNRPIKMKILERLCLLISSAGCSSSDICISLKTHFVEGDTSGNIWSVHYEINLVFLQDKIGLPWEIKGGKKRWGGGWEKSSFCFGGLSEIHFMAFGCAIHSKWARIRVELHAILTSETLLYKQQIGNMALYVFVHLCAAWMHLEWIPGL